MFLLLKTDEIRLLYRKLYILFIDLTAVPRRKNSAKYKTYQFLLLTDDKWRSLFEHIFQPWSIYI